MNPNSQYIIAIDVGGTSLKWSLISPDAQELSLVRQCFQKNPIDPHGSSEMIIGSFARTIGLGMEKANELAIGIVGVGVSIPGPFDFKAGISFMTDTEQKYQAINGINLRRELRSRLNLAEDFPIKFYNDAEMFLAGEAFSGSAKGFNRIVGLTLGTGVGSAFMAEKQFVRQGPQVPPKGTLYAVPFRDGIVEDRISRRGILKKYHKLSGVKCSDIDVKDLASMALSGDETALRVFEALDEMLCEILYPILTKFQADCLVFGGQISKSFRLFSKNMWQKLNKIPSMERIAASSLWDLAAIVGVSSVFWTEFESVYLG